MKRSRLLKLIGRQYGRPKGTPYCYTTSGTWNENGYLNTQYCRYHKTIQDEGVNIVWCAFLQQGGLGKMSDEEFAKLEKKYGEDEVFEKYPLDLLFDSCRSCRDLKDKR